MSNVLYNPKGQIAGHIEDDTYITMKDPEKHFFRMYQGYGISISILSHLEKNNIKFVQITETGTNKVFKIKVSDYLKSDKQYNFGNDIQKFVSVIDFSTDKTKPLSNWWEVAK